MFRGLSCCLRACACCAIHVGRQAQSRGITSDTAASFTTQVQARHTRAAGNNVQEMDTQVARSHKEV